MKFRVISTNELAQPYFFLVVQHDRKMWCINQYTQRHAANVAKRVLQQKVLNKGEESINLEKYSRVKKASWGIALAYPYKSKGE